MTGNCSLKKLAHEGAVFPRVIILLVNIQGKRTRLASKQKTFNFLGASLVSFRLHEILQELLVAAPFKKAADAASNQRRHLQLTS